MQTVLYHLDLNQTALGETNLKLIPLRIRKAEETKLLNLTLSQMTHKQEINEREINQKLKQKIEMKQTQTIQEL